MDINALHEVGRKHPQLIMQPYDAIMERENGFEAICEFTAHYGGLTVYVPQLRTIFAGCIEEEVRRECRNGNIAPFAKKFGYSERHLRRVIGKG